MNIPSAVLDRRPRSLRTRLKRLAGVVMVVAGVGQLYLSLVVY